MIRQLQPVRPDLDRIRDARGEPVRPAADGLQHAEHGGSSRITSWPRRYAWSNGGKTLTITTRSGVKWSDGKPFSASDVAFTFNLIKTNSALNANWTIPTPASVTGDQRHHHRADLLAAGAGQRVLHPADADRAAAHLEERVRPGHVRRREPGRHRPVRARPLQLDGLHHEDQPGLLRQVQPARAGDSASPPTRATPTCCRRRQRHDRLVRDLDHRRAAELPGQEHGQHDLDRVGAVLQRQQRRGPVLQHHQGAAERRRRAPGDQLRDQPAAAVDGRRVRQRAAGDQHGRHDPAGPAAATCRRRWPTTCPPPGDAAKVRLDPDRRRIQPRSAATGRRAARRSRSRSRTRSATPTTTPTRSCS